MEEAIEVVLNAKSVVLSNVSVSGLALLQAIENFVSVEELRTSTLPQEIVLDDGSTYVAWVTFTFLKYFRIEFKIQILG